MLSKCAENKNVAHEPQASVSLVFLPLFWCPLWSSPITEQTHVRKMESFCFIQIFTVKTKKDKPAVYCLAVHGFVPV